MSKTNREIRQSLQNRCRIALSLWLGLAMFGGCSMQNQIKQSPLPLVEPTSITESRNSVESGAQLGLPRKLLVAQTGASSYRLSDEPGAPNSQPVSPGEWTEPWPEVDFSAVQLASAELPEETVGPGSTTPSTKKRSWGFSSVKSALTSWRGPDSETAFQAARELELRGEYSTALAEYQKIVDKDADYAPAFHRLAVSAEMVGNPQQAGTAFEQAVQLNPEDVTLLCDCGYHHHRAGNLQMAQQYYRQAISLDPSHVRANNHLGALYAESGYTNQAVQHFQAAGLTPQEIQENLQLARQK